VAISVENQFFPATPVYFTPPLTGLPLELDIGNGGGGSKI